MTTPNQEVLAQFCSVADATFQVLLSVSSGLRVLSESADIIFYLASDHEIAQVISSSRFLNQVPRG